MKANELRIGNWYNEFGIAKQVTPDTILRLYQIELAGKIAVDVSPIPLTEEWVLKFGFDKTSYSEFEFLKNSSFRLCGFGWTIEQYTIQFGWVELNTLSSKYVHQLQNLYFALTGEELVCLL